MHLAFNDDQTTFAAVLDQILGGADSGFRPAPGWARFDYGHALDASLDAAGFFGAAVEDTLGPVMAAEMVARVAALPVAVECAASALLRPFAAVSLPRPVAVIDGTPGAAVRYLPVARSVLWLAPDAVRAAVLPDGAAGQIETPYAYPMGRIDAAALDWADAGLDPARARALWQVATAAELAGLLSGGLDAVLAHVRTRQQFGRPLGAFQAVQHRLAAAAVQIEGARWLALRAAATGGAGDAALALGRAQTVSGGIVQDLHQFMGAMGLTLEHPLHRWTGRARLLRAAMGGPSAALRAYADDRWGPA